MSYQTHSFPAFYTPQSQILILGSFPSVKSRDQSFYYMHQANRFWTILSRILDDDFVTASVDEKKRLLERHHIALYDVIETCEIQGSSDHLIKDPTPTDLSFILQSAPIHTILLNGQLAWKLFRQYQPKFPLKCMVLPSTSAANAQYPLSSLIKIWSEAFL